MINNIPTTTSTNINFSNLRGGAMGSGTAAVQSFIRFIVWMLTMGVLFLLIMVPFSLIKSDAFAFVLVINVFISTIVAKMFFILPEWKKMVLLRLGKFDSVKGAGFIIVPPFIYSVASIIDNRIETQQVEATATLTKDNVPTKVTAAIEYKVEDAKKAVIDVKDYRSSVIWLSTEALKNTIGSMDLKGLLSERDKIAADLKVQIDKGASVYGVDVRAVRITDIDTPQSLVEELAVIARARRAAEAKNIQAEAEVMVATKIAEASKKLQKQKGGMELRQLQAISEMSKEESSMIIIYPYGDSEGRKIAQAASSRQDRMGKKK
ncbi:SPFH domain-containing protein [Patescibacteria group bacterium]